MNRISWFMNLDILSLYKILKKITKAYTTYSERTNKYLINIDNFVNEISFFCDTYSYIYFDSVLIIETLNEY